MDTCPDHMYIQLDIPPWYCARDFIRRLKSSSSRELSQRYPEQGHNQSFWADGYLSHLVR